MEVKYAGCKSQLSPEGSNHKLAMVKIKMRLRREQKTSTGNRVIFDVAKLHDGEIKIKYE